MCRFDPDRRYLFPNVTRIALDFSAAASAPAPRISAVQRRCVLALLALALGLRVLYAFIYRIDSDEPQHLHIVWGWATGLLQYRDVFDNHAPLFHILCAPLFRLFGEHADIIIFMRLAMLLFYGLSLWAVWKIGANLFSARVGVWAVVFAALEPRFFYTSTEFRTDDMWAATWLLTLVVLIGGSLSPRRLFAAGVLFGATFGVSMKTSLLAAALLLSVAFTLLLEWHRGGWRVKWTRLFAGTAAAAAGVALIPAALIAYFASQHALGSLYYCVIQHNLVPGLKRANNIGAHSIVFAVALPFLLAATYFAFRAAPAEPVRRRFWRGALFLTPLFYYTLLWCFWPDLTREDYLPYSPLVIAAVVTPILLGSLDWLLQKSHFSPPWAWAAPTALALAEIAMIVSSTKPWHNDAQRDILAYDQILSLTKPGEYVMDGKAGAIFRPRPYYYALETVTHARIRKGLLANDVVEHIISAHTAVASLAGFSHEEDVGDFLRDNYLGIGSERADKVVVLGKLLDTSAPGRPVPFDLRIGAPYAFVDAKGRTVAGSVDGTPVRNPVTLAPGAHEFLPAPGSPRVTALFWQNALDKGFLPSFADGLRHPQPPQK